MNPGDGIGAIELFGTTEAPPERRLLKAGHLSAILEEGNLRDIRFRGVEVLRAVNYLARDASWGTVRSDISELEVAQGAQGFEVRYVGLCGGARAGFAYRMHIRGEASGSLVLEAEGVALDDFATSRTGFVVLHPADAAGGTLTVRHTTGDRDETAFPDLISADQPAFDIQALVHEPAPGLTCTVEMEGDAFEMEDQRNWADASFKTYVRPLSKPRPYVIAKGKTDLQRIAVTLKGKVPAARRSQSGGVAVSLGRVIGTMPRMALFLDEAGPGADPPPAGLMQTLIARADPGNDADPSRLARAAELARAGGASLAVELVLDARDPDGEAAAAMRHLEEAGAAASALLVSPRREFKTRPSGTLPTGERPVGDLVAALRKAGFAGPIGAGTPSYFAEFNRNPPGDDCDFIFFGVAGTVHAADDISVMETIEVYPQLVKSARALRPGKAVWLGPCTIGVRHNPYGADVQPNPRGGRVPSARIDPRQARLFGAAFAAGIAAQAAAARVGTLTLASIAGPFGLFEDDNSARPIGRVQAELACAAGAQSLALDFTGQGVTGIAYRSGTAPRALIANLTADPIALTLPGDFRTVELVGAGPATLLNGHGFELPAYRSAILSA